jgi:hypothetical protein
MLRSAARLVAAAFVLLVARNVSAEPTTPSITPSQPVPPVLGNEVPLLETNPTPATPIGQGFLPAPPSLEHPRDEGPPFTAVLPPSVPLPRAAPQIPATPPPGQRPAPYRLPERPGATPPAGGLRQALSEYDRRLGLGAGGAVEDLARTDLVDSSAVGSAVLEVRVDRSGVVRTVRVVSASQDLADWQQLARELRGARAGRIRMPAGAAGAWMRIGLEARVTDPSGLGRPFPLTLYPGAVGFDVTSLAHASDLRTVFVSVLSEVWY